MDVLGLLATAVLTKEYQREIPQEPLPLIHKPMAQVAPVYRLEGRSTNESFAFEQNERWNSVEMETPVSDIDLDTDSDTDLDTDTDSDVDTDSDADEMPQFSATAFLEGEAILGVSGVSGRNLDDSIVFQESIELTLGVSFTGEDFLEVGLESGNAIAFSYVEELTFEGRLGFPSDTVGDRFELSELSYEFPVSGQASLYISTTGDDLEDFNLLGDSDGASGEGAISEFGTENPIHSLVEDVGLQLNYDLTDELGISFGYFSEEASDPDSGAGLFNGNRSAFVQVGFESGDRFLLGFTYIHTYSDSSLETETGSLRSQIEVERPVIGNSYGISASFSPSSRFAIGGWVGLTNATVLDLGDADVWNYALTLAFPDLGQEGNLLGIVIGQEPRLTGTSGFMIDDQRSDSNTSLHIEAFYNNRLSDHISITPGLVWITAPNHDNSNPDIVVFTIRTTFEF